MSPTQMLRRLGTLAAVATLAITFGVTQLSAMGTDTPSDDKKKEKKDQKAIDTPDEQLAYTKFVRGYREARELILAGQYEAGIAAMHALNRDDHPDVANYIGYADRKRGNFEAAKYWYEKALAADPNHVRTWSYYGMLHAQTGNKLMAEQYLQKVKHLCGTTSCKEFLELRDVIDNNATY